MPKLKVKVALKNAFNVNFVYNLMKWGPGLEHSLKVALQIQIHGKKDEGMKIGLLEGDMCCEGNRSAQWNVPTSSPAKF